MCQPAASEFLFGRVIAPDLKFNGEHMHQRDAASSDFSGDCALCRSIRTTKMVIFADGAYYS